MLVPHFGRLFKFVSHLGLIYFVSIASISLPGNSKQKEREKVRKAKDPGVDG